MSATHPDSRCGQMLPLWQIATHDVACLPEMGTLGDAAGLMATRRISSIVVVDDGGQPSGIVTERDIVRAMRSASSPDLPLKSAMSTPVISVPEHIACQDAYLTCLRRGIRHLALVNDQGRLAGVVSETDFRLHMDLATLAGREPVAAVMTRAVLSLAGSATLREAVELMEHRRDSCVVVVEGERPVGIVTERDVVRCYSEMEAERPPKLEAVMTSPVHAVSMDTSVHNAAERMLEAEVRHLVVVDGNGVLAGIVSEHELTRMMAHAFFDVRLESERAFLRALFDAIPDLVWLKNLEGVYLACNPRFELFFGAREADIVGKTDYDFVDRGLADIFRDQDRQTLARNGPTTHEEWIVFSSDGHRELLETIKTPMRDAGGRLVGVLGIGRDVTAIRKAQEALEESEEKLRTLIDAIPDSVQFKDAEGRWLAYNRTAACAFGLEGVDCRNRSDEELAELAAPDRRDALRQCRQTDLEAFRAGGVSHVEEAITLADGKTRDFDVAKIPLYRDDGTAKGLVILARDVTENRRMTLALERSLGDFNDLVSRIPVGVFKFRVLADGRRRFDYVSPRWCEMVGISAEEAYRNVEASFRRAHPDDREGFLRAIEQTIAARAPFEWEGRISSEAGVRWLHIAASPAVLENGDVRWDGMQYDITERKQAEERLILIDFALNHINDAAYMADGEGRLRYVNDVACRTLGYSRDELLRLSVADVDDFLRPEDWPQTWRQVERQGSLTFDSRHKAKDGRRFPVEVRVNYFRYFGKPYSLALARDVSKHKEAEEKLRLAASVFTNTHEGIVVTDATARIVEVNKAFSRITGYTREEVLGKNPSLLKSGHQDRDFYQEMWQTLAREGHWSGEVWNRRRNGEVYAEHITISAVRREDGAVSHYVGLFSDITPMKEQQRRLERIAHYDALTGVPNRVLLADRMAQAVAQTLRADTLMAVCYLDLDGFKPINDSQGHEAGDRLLIEMARRMKSCLRGGDTIARIGGDEFVLLLLGLGHVEECEAALERILEAIRRPFAIDGKQAILSASIGVTLFPEDDADADTLLRHADQAMYDAKESGRNRYHLFDPERGRQMKVHRERIRRLQEALDRHEFTLYYQPKVDLGSGEVLGVEALIRWRQPGGDLLLPAEFLPAIKGSDLEIAVGEWVLETSLGQIEAWQASGLSMNVSVNIGADHLLRPDFALRLQSLLERHPDAPADALELEILESTAIADTEQAALALAACRRIGVKFALDDFGTGYSSLTYFRRLPVETLKIDQSFVRGMLEDPEDLGIVESVVRLAHAFNRAVIAEGVETEEHCAVLSRLRCPTGQGFGIARPMPADLLPEWIADWRHKRQWKNFAKMKLPKKPKDMVLKTAIESHKKWVEAVADYLRSPRAALKPPIHSHHCRFGVWYHGTGTIRYGHLAKFSDLNAPHEMIHALAAELADLVEQGRQGDALQGLGELYALRDNFVSRMERLMTTLGTA